jgi:hypothetical protein
VHRHVTPPTGPLRNRVQCPLGTTIYPRNAAQNSHEQSVERDSQLDGQTFGGVVHFKRDKRAKVLVVRVPVGDVVFEFLLEMTGRELPRCLSARSRLAVRA